MTVHNKTFSYFMVLNEFKNFTSPIGLNYIFHIKTFPPSIYAMAYAKYSSISYLFCSIKENKKLHILFFKFSMILMENNDKKANMCLFLLNFCTRNYRKNSNHYKIKKLILF